MLTLSARLHALKAVAGSVLLSTSLAAQASSSGLETAADLVSGLVPLYALSLTYSHADPVGRSQFLTSAAANYLATTGLKSMVGAKRPNGSDGSFPSRHTSAAFQGAGFIHARYGFDAALPAYVASSIVAYSRVQTNHHYARDVVAGAALGVASAFLMADSFRPFGAQVLPTVGAGHVGVLLQKPW